MRTAYSAGGPKGTAQSRRQFLKLLAGGVVALPAAAWAMRPSAAGAGDGQAAARPRPTETPQPTPDPMPPIPAPIAPVPPAGPPSAIGGLVLNVRHFGARGNGVSDDTRAIQTAIDAASRRTNGTVLLPKGRYRISRGLRIERPVRITGEGADATTIVAGVPLDIVTVKETSNVEIVHLGMTSLGQPGDGGSAIELVDAADVTIQHCHIATIPDTAIGLTRVTRVTIEDSTFYDVLGSGIRMHHPGEGGANTYVTVRRNTFVNVAQWDPAGHAAVQSHGGYGFTQAHVWVEENYIESRSVGIGLDAVDYAVVARNRVVGNGERGEGIAFTGSHNRIEANEVNNCDAAGILLWGVEYRPIENNVIEGNTCWDNAQGIAVVCGRDGTVINGLQILGNRCYASSPASPQKFGIQSYINRATDFRWVDVLIAGNDLRGNTHGPINLVRGSDATIVDNLG